MELPAILHEVRRAYALAWGSAAQVASDGKLGYGTRYGAMCAGLEGLDAWIPRLERAGTEGGELVAIEMVGEDRARLRSLVPSCMDCTMDGHLGYHGRVWSLAPEGEAREVGIAPEALAAAREIAAGEARIAVVRVRESVIDRCW